MDLHDLLNSQRQAFLADGYPSRAVRIDRMDRAIRMLLTYEAEIVESYVQDFGCRSRVASKTGDILGSIEVFEFTKQHLEGWMQPIPIDMPPSEAAIGVRAEVQPTPLGVIGAMVPWNSPVLMACLAMAGAFGAGNRIMIKVSEFTPRTAQIFARAIAEFFDPTEAYVVEGDAAVSAAFAKLPFDHLIFTGSTGTGRKVMLSAAENLVPVTLELGGKCPVVVGKDADMELAATRIMMGKLSSAGQVCVSPDYLYLPVGRTQEFIEHALRVTDRFYPDLLNNDEYTSIITPAHRNRIVALVEDAVAKGAKTVQFPDQRMTETRLPFIAVTGVTAQMKIMQEEIFGPLLPIFEYERIDEPLSYIEANPHPLAASYFGPDEAERAEFAARVQTGAVLFDDVRVHIFYEALPFGGVGESGIGRYRGHAGFIAFSNLKTVFHQSSNEEVLTARRPPYGKDAYAAIDAEIARLKSVWLQRDASE